MVVAVGEIIGLELDRCWPPWGCFEGGLSEAEVGASECAGWVAWADDEKVRRRYAIDCSRLEAAAAGGITLTHRVNWQFLLILFRST